MEEESAVSPAPYEVWNVSDWPVMFQETRGLDPKDWIAPQEQVDRSSQAAWWLFKPVKVASYRRFDDWAERLASELAGLIDLPAARVELARGLVDEGIISRNVTPDGWSLESGDTMLSEYDDYVTCASDDRPRNRVGHNLTNIRSVLDGASGPPGTTSEGWAAFDVFVGYLVFDAWIANTDRHAINWGVLTRDEDGGGALAATFDHGSALASGVKDEDLDLTTIEAYAGKGFAHRFENGRKLPLVDLALAAETMGSPEATVWRERVAALSAPELDAVIGRIDGMSGVRRTFLGSLLTTNQRRLRP